MWFRYAATMDILIISQGVGRLSHTATSTLEKHRAQPSGQILYWVATCRTEHLLSAGWFQREGQEEGPSIVC